MITLYGFGRNFGLPDPSPFVTKAEVLLKMSGLTFQRDDTGFNKAPKGKLPYIDDNGTIIADFDLHPLAPRAAAWHRLRSTAVVTPEGGRLGG